MKTLEKALGLHLFWTGGLTSLWQLDRHTKFNASKGDDAWLFVKIDRKPSITVSTNKGRLDSHLTSRGIRIFLPSLVFIPEVSILTRQESWLRWTNPSIKWTSLQLVENIPQVPAANWENRWVFPLAARWGPIPLHYLQRNSMLPIKDIRNLDFLDGTPENPQEHCHKMRRTLMSPQECKRNCCTPNQFKLKRISPTLAP